MRLSGHSASSVEKVDFSQNYSAPSGSSSGGSNSKPPSLQPSPSKVIDSGEFGDLVGLALEAQNRADLVNTWGQKQIKMAEAGDNVMGDAS